MSKERSSIRSEFDKILGICCYYLIPIKKQYFLGNGSHIAICTLSSLKLLEKIGKDREIMNKISIVGRLLSENRGIDQIIKFTEENKKIHTILMCGKDVRGHFSGQALISLKKNGINRQKRIIGAKGPYPILSCTEEQIENFRNKIELIDKIGSTDFRKLKSIVVSS